MFRFLKKDWKGYFNKGAKYAQASKFPQAAKFYRKARDCAAEEPYPHYELGHVLMIMENYPEALIELKRANELSLGFFIVQTEIYICEEILAGHITQDIVEMLRTLWELSDSGKKHSDQTVELSREIIQQSPHFALGHFYLGKALFGKDPAVAEQALKHCLDYGADDTTAINAKIHLAIILREKGNEEEAKRLCEKIVSDYPGNPHTSLCELVVS